MNKIAGVLIWVCRLAVAGVFVAAALPKLHDPASFAEALRNYQVFPYWSYNALALFVPVLELLCALGLCAPNQRIRKASANWLIALVFGFVVLLTSVVLRGIDLNCGCFGAVSTAPTTWWDVGLRTILLLGVWVARQNISSPKNKP